MAEAGSYDYVFDAVGKSSLGACERLLKARGVYSSSELGRGGQNLPLALTTPLWRGKRVVFPLPVAKGGSLDFIAQRIEARRFRPVIDRSYALDEVRDAYAYVASGQKTGNVVLRLR